MPFNAMKTFSFKDMKPGPEYWNWRFDDDMVFKDCAENQTINVIPKDAVCVYSSDSFGEFLREEQKKVIYLSEAEIKTYPTDFLTKGVMKVIRKNLHKDVYAGESLEKPRHLFELTSETVRCVPISDFGIDMGKSVVIECEYDYVEGEVAGRVIYNVYGNLDKHLAEDLSYEAYSYGYNFVTIDHFLNGSETLTKLIFETKFQEGGFELKGNFLWHVCPLRVKEKILKTGLHPKSKSRMNGRKLDHDDRIYFFTKIPTDSFSRNFMTKSEKVKDDEKIVLLKIDRKKIPHLKLYRDNMSKSLDPKNPIAVYCLNNVPPDAISVEKEIII